MSKVLIVDDDEEIRAIVSDCLQEEGFEVSLAKDGAEALAILRREGGFLILLDLMMPNIDGRQVIQALQTDPSLLNGNKVVVMSAGSRLSSVRPLLGTSLVVALLSKPFELDRLLTLTHQLSA